MDIHGFFSNHEFSWLVPEGKSVIGEQIRVPSHMTIASAKCLCMVGTALYLFIVGYTDSYTITDILSMYVYIYIYMCVCV